MLKIGTHAKVIDENSDFFGIDVIITDIRTEPKPRPFKVYKVKTENGIPPKGYPFSFIMLREEQLRII